MPARFCPRPSYVAVAATLALFIALTGTASAVNGPAPGINSVGTADIINQEVKSADIKPLAVGPGKIALNAVTTAKVLDNSLTGADILDNSLTGADINESSLVLNVTGGPCPIGQFVRNLSSALALTCGPTGIDTALGTGALDSNTSGGGNTAVGQGALTANTTGDDNTAVGRAALQNNASSASNTAVGGAALASNTSGSTNSAVGESALGSNTSGDNNSALGQGALGANLGGASNSALGQGALGANTTASNNTAVGESALGQATGGDNTALGKDAGNAITTGTNNISIDNAGAAESDTIRIGDTQTSAFLAGVSGAVVGANPAVVVTGAGRLGVATSSRRFKRDIRALGARSDQLMQLRPVSFRYEREHLDGGPDRVQYGLIAEEVAKVYPELVAYRDGRPYTVLYQELPALLLAKAQEQERRIARLEASLARLKK